MQQRGVRCCFGFVLQVIEDLLDHHWVFDAGNNLHCAATFTTGFDVDVANALQALRPAHRGPALGGCLRFIGYLALVPLAPTGRNFIQPLYIEQALSKKNALVNSVNSTCKCNSAWRNIKGSEPFIALLRD